MGLGSTAKKLQKVAEMADKLYSRVNELKAQLEALRETVERTDERVDAMDRELTEQRALLEALAEAEGVDVEAVLEEAETAADAETASPSATE